MVVKLAPPLIVKLAPDALSLRLVRALAPLWFSMAPEPVNVMPAELVTIPAALLAFKVPGRLYTPPEIVVPEMFVRLPFTSNVLRAPTVNVPLLVKAPAVVKLAPPCRLKLDPVPMLLRGDRRF